ncbi:antifreeze protein [Sedimentitalea arenosa]|nr:antifreeze protein [Arenibacterium arenosum]
MKRSDPFQLWRLGYDMSVMLAEAQMVIWMRTLGMMGGWSVPASENSRMVSEKVDAWTRAAMAAGTATMAGKSPLAVAATGLAPISRKTRSNARRLGKRGPQFR